MLLHIKNKECAAHYYLLKSECHLIDDIDIVSASLVVHAPSAVDKFQLALFDQIFDDILFVLGLLIPPFLEEGHLSIGKPVVE